MPISPEEIVQRYEWRKRAQGQAISKMAEIQRVYDGDVVVPLPELDDAEKPAVANLLAQGVDQLAMRIASRLPDVAFPLLSKSDAERRRASDARKAVLGWWDMNQMPKKFARRARYLVGYGCSPVIVRPVAAYKSERKIPYWHVLNPLTTYPAPSADPDCIEPDDAIIVRQQSLAWLRANYPLQAQVLYKGRDAQADTMLDLLEYHDANETVLIVRGKNAGDTGVLRDWDTDDGGTSMVEELERTENRSGICGVVVPGRITMSRLSGHFSSIIGMFMAQAKMTAYEQIAIFKSIFPELWVVTHPNSPGTARIVVAADGKQGIIGEIENGTIMPITTQPNPQVPMSIDRLERAQRVQASIPSDWGAESATNIRTARRGEQVMGSAVDPTIGEGQTVFAESFVAEDERAIAIAKSYWGGRSFSFYIPRSGRVEHEDYVPNTVFRNDFHFVKFSLPGVDAAGIPIEIGQRTGMGEMSMTTARQVDPMIEDPELEAENVDLEGIRGAILKGLEQQAASGAIDLHEVAKIAEKRVQGGMTLEAAVLAAQQELQQEQAALAQSQPGAPETMPGMAQAPPPGAGAGGQPPNLAQLLTQLRTAPHLSPQELGLQGGAPPTGGMPLAGAGASAPAGGAA